MMIERAVKRGFEEALKFDRLFYFLFLNLFFGLSALLLLMPVLHLLPEFLLWSTFSPAMMFSITLLFIIAIIVQLVQVWFEGTLVHVIRKKKRFVDGLRHAKKFLWQLVLFYIVLLIIRTVVSYIPYIANLADFAVAWFLMFSIPFIVLSKDTADIAIMKSADFVRDNWLDTLLLFIMMTLIKTIILIVFASVSIIAFLYPFLVDLYQYLLTITFVQTITTEQLIGLIGIFRGHSFAMLGVIIVFSLYFAFSKVFTLATVTHYLTSKKRKI